MSQATSERGGHLQREALRECWAELKNPALRSFDDNDFSRSLRARHADVLAALVAGGALDAAVAEEITAAFAQAILHIQGQMSLCYIAMPVEHLPRHDLMRQVAVLEEVAVKSEIDPATVAQARAALERDIAWLAQFNAGETPETLWQTPVGVTSAQAAKVLADLLSGE